MLVLTGYSARLAGFVNTVMKLRFQQKPVYFLTRATVDFWSVQEDTRRATVRPTALPAAPTAPLSPTSAQLLTFLLLLHIAPFGLSLLASASI
jgi:hypothetical protein